MGRLSCSKEALGAAASREKTSGISRALILNALAISLLANGSSGKKMQVEMKVIEAPSPEFCPPCDLLFSKLERAVEGGRVQHVTVQERGEPKSGTSFAMEWAAESLCHACDYLNGLYGQGSCQVVIDIRTSVKLASLTFKPGTGDRGTGSCHCEDVKRVDISIKAYHKHVLPVNGDCPWNHINMVSRESLPCVFKDGSEPSNYEGLLGCMEDLECRIEGPDLQMAIFRDPRPMAVSSYFYLKSRGHRLQNSNETVDGYLLRMFPILCQWVGIRFYLFEGPLSSQSASFWYHEAMEDPLAWHSRLFHLVGLQLPESVVQAVSIATKAGDIRFQMKGRDEHAGEEESSSNRTYVDEIQEETRAFLDATVLKWTPPTLRAKMGDKFHE